MGSKSNILRKLIELFDSQWIRKTFHERENRRADEYFHALKKRQCPILLHNLGVSMSSLCNLWESVVLNAVKRREKCIIELRS